MVYWRVAYSVGTQISSVVIVENGTRWNGGRAYKSNYSEDGRGKEERLKLNFNLVRMPAHLARVTLCRHDVGMIAGTNHVCLGMLWR